MKTIARWIGSIVIAVATVTVAAQPSPAVLQRVRSIAAALNAPSADFERFAQENYTAAYLATQTAADRKAFVETLQSELGTIEIGNLSRESPTRIVMKVVGRKGKTANLTLDYEAETFRIAGLALEGTAEDPSLPPPVPVRGSMPTNELTAAVDRYLQALADQGRLSGVLLIARDGKTLFEKGYNLANRSDGIPNRPATRFHLGSINKAFTTVSIAQLAAAGKLALDDTIGKHIPDYPNADAKRVTLRQLLNHTGGLAGFWTDEFARTAKSRFRTNRDMYEFVAPKPLQFEPGSRKEYCNSCYIVLGEVIARVSGVPYEKYVERNVFERAGMKTAGFFQTDEVRPNMATHYTSTPEGLRNIVHMHNAGGNAAGGAWATAADLLIFDNAARDGKLLDPVWTAWFFGEEKPASGRVTKQRGMFGGAPGINAAAVSDETWTVAAVSNFDERFMENLALALSRALTQ